LKARAAIPIEPQPLEVPHAIIDVLGPATLTIEILDAQDDATALAAHAPPSQEETSSVTEV